MRRACTNPSSRFAVEPLEPRVLLSATFSAAFVGRVPAFVFPDRPARAVVRITNPASRSSAAQLNLFASPTPDLSPTAQLIAQSAPITASHKTVGLRFSSSVIPAAGSYYLIAQLVPLSAHDGATALDAVAPAVMPAPRPTQFVASNVDLTTQLIRQSPSPLFVSARGSTRAAATVLVLNAGTTTAVGTLTASVYASTSPTFDATATLIGSTALAHVNIPSGTSHTLSVPLTLPAGTPPGSYYLFAVVNASGAIAESNPANNITRSLSPLTVTNSAPVPSHHHHNHDHIAGGVGIIDYTGYDIPVDFTPPPDQSDTSAEDSASMPSADDGTSDTSTTAPATQPTTDPTTQPSDPTADPASNDSSDSTSSTDDSNW